MSAQKYVARAHLRIPAGRSPGSEPLEVTPGDIISFDGDEGVNIQLLLDCGAIRPYKRKARVAVEERAE